MVRPCPPVIATPLEEQRLSTSGRLASSRSGKSTISQLLLQRLPNSAHIQGDWLRHFVPWLPLEPAVSITIQNIASVASNFLDAGFNVVIDYPLSRPDYERLASALGAKASSTHAFVLSPRLEIAQARRGDRVLSEWEVSRIGYHYTSGLNDPGFGLIVDNSEQTPEETASLILEATRASTVESTVAPCRSLER
jgi:hypothetical protein